MDATTTKGHPMNTDKELNRKLSELLVIKYVQNYDSDYRQGYAIPWPEYRDKDGNSVKSSDMNWSTDKAQAMDLAIEFLDKVIFTFEKRGGLFYVYMDYDETGNKPPLEFEGDTLMQAIVKAVIALLENSDE